MVDLAGPGVFEDYDKTLRAAVAQANVPTLQMVLVQLTGDERWIEAPYLCSRPQGIDDNDSGGLPRNLQSEIRAAAVDAILAWKAGEPIAIPRPSPDLIVRIMTATMGERVPSDYGPFLQFKFDNYTGQADEAITNRPPEGFKALIIGAGMAGLCAAVRLKQAGVAFEIVEKAEEVAGVWQQNTYPGCGVDTASHLYSYSFAQGHWKHWFGARDEIVQYFTDVARDFGILDHVSFGAHVTGTRYNESTHQWETDVRRTDGTEQRLVTNVVIAAVGAFGTPKWPTITGLNTFAGPLMHSARWDASIDLSGKRVAVIGNGASAMQIVPTIEGRVASLAIFQRSKQWVAPFPKYRQKISDPIRFLFGEFPLYEWWYRLRLSWTFDSKVYESLKVDPDWYDAPRSLNATNDGHRRFFTRYALEQLGHRIDLAAKVIPSFPPYGKRMLLDNGWFRTLTRPHVELVDEPISEINETGITTGDGRHREFDIIIVASGFDVARFLAPVKVYGRDGVSIPEAWDDDNPKAYLGTVTPRFPNFFMLYGPNTALGHGGSFVFVVECQVNYLLAVLDKMFEQDLVEVECRQEVCEEYNDVMDDMHSRMIWQHPGMTTYYRNSRGRVVFNSPWRTNDYWRMTRHADMADFHTKTQDVDTPT